MYKYLSLALLASLMQLSQGAANEPANTDGKVYVRPRAVRFMKKGIIVHTKEGAFVTPTVSRDENGIFVQQKDLVAAPDVQKRKRCCGNKAAGRKNWHKKAKFGRNMNRPNRWKKRAEQVAIAPDAANIVNNTAG